MENLRRIKGSFVFWIFSAYVIVVGGHLIYRTFAASEQTREARGFFLQHALKTSRSLLKDGRARELGKYLADSVSTGLIDYFEIEEKNKTETGGASPSERPILSEPVTEKNGWVWGKAEVGEATVRLASGYGWRTRFTQVIAADRDRMPADFFFLVLACVLSAFFHGQKLPQSHATMTEGFRRGPRRTRAARSESGRRPGMDAIDFVGVCGRAALLQQAELAGRMEPEPFFALLEEFYADCSAVVTRYKGKVHAVQGHELLFFFSEGEPATLARLALAAARDLAALAEKRSFVLGTALASGRMHGGPLLSSYALFGTPLEESAEMLRTLAPTESAIWVSEAVAKAAGAHAQFRPLNRDGRKSQARALSSLGALKAAIAGGKKGEGAELAYHRSDSALAEILCSLATDEDWEREKYVGVVNELRQVQCRRCGPDVVNSFRQLLVAELGRKDSYRLSSVLALAAHLLHRVAVDKAMEKLFLQAITVKDRRVRANAVELFTKFFPEREIPELRSLIRDGDNRVSANALIKAACERFDEKVIARIEERVRGGSVAHVASALHAVGEIALYYRRHDPLFLGTKLAFLRLFENVPDWARHPNPMIRRQALIAAKKLQSPVVDAQLQEVFAETTDVELLELFASVYGWRKEDKKAAA